MNKRSSSFVAQVFGYFGATVFSAIFSIALLPLATKVLGPEDFGAYSFAMSITALAAILSDLGSGIVLPEHYHDLDKTARRPMLTTLLSVAFVISCFFSVGVFFSWSWVSQFFNGHQAMSLPVLVLICLTVPLRSLLTLSTTIFIIQSRAGLAGIITVIQQFIVFSLTLSAIFVWHLGAMSLFIGNAAGLFVGVLIAMMMLRPHLSLFPSLHWFKVLLKAAPSTSSIGIFDSLRPVIENMSLAKMSGLASVGIYTHSRLYYSYFMQASNAFSYTLWPRSLAAARDPNSTFIDIGRAWNVVYLGFTFAGITFAAFGHELISLLTNGKFVEAAKWAPCWIGYLLLQNSGKVPTAVLYSAKKGALMNWYRVGTGLFALIAVFFFVPQLGILAAIVIAFLEMLTFRLLLQYTARQIRKLPFQDGWAFAGLIIILAFTFWIYNFDIELQGRIQGFLIVSLVLLGLSKNIVFDAIKQLRTFLFRPLSKDAS